MALVCPILHAQNLNDYLEAEQKLRTQWEDSTPQREEILTQLTNNIVPTPEHLELIAQLQESYNEVNEARTLFFISSLLAQVEEIQFNTKFLSKNDAIHVEGLIDELKAISATLATMMHVDSADDPKGEHERNSNVRSFIRITDQLNAKFLSASIASNRSLQNNPPRQRSDQLKKLKKTIEAVHALLPAVSYVVRNDLRDPNRHQGLSAGLRTATTALSRSEGITFETIYQQEGQDRLPVAPKNSDDIYFLLPSHSQGLLEVAGVAQLDGAENYTPFSTTHLFTPPFIDRHFVDSTEVIKIGDGSNKPIERATKLLQEVGKRNFILFPEGGVSSGLWDIKPARSKFGWGLLRTISHLKNPETGNPYNITLIPITAPDNLVYGNIGYEALGEASAYGPHKKETPDNPRIIVGKALGNSLVRSLLDSPDPAHPDRPRNLTQVIRHIWMTNLEHNEKKTFGAPTAKATEKIIEEKHAALFPEHADTIMHLRSLELEKVPANLQIAETAAIQAIEQIPYTEIERQYLTGPSQDFLDRLTDVDQLYAEALENRMRHLLDFFSKAIIETLDESDLSKAKHKERVALYQAFSAMLDYRSEAIKIFDQGKFPTTELNRFQNNLIAFDQAYQMIFPETQRSWLQIKTESLKNFWRDIGVNHKIAKILGGLYLNKGFRQAPRTQTPIVKGLSDFFGAIAKREGKSVETTGMEHITGATLGENDLLLTLPVHAHPYNDNISWSHIGLDPNNLLFFAKTDGFLPPAFTKLLGESNNIIEVTQENGVKSALRMIDQSEEGHGLKTGVVFPQGNISAGFFDVPPVAPSFTRLLLKKIVSSGVNLRIVPVSMPRNMATLNEMQSSEGKNIQVIIHPEIPSEVAKSLINDNPAGFNALMRSLWRASDNHGMSERQRELLHTENLIDDIQRIIRTCRKLK